MAMEGMQVLLGVISDEGGPAGTTSSITKTLTFGGVTAIAEIGVTSFSPTMTQINVIPGTTPTYIENPHMLFCA